MNDANMWKYNGHINAGGAIATLGVGFGIPQHLGKEVQSHYLFDDLTMTSLLLFGTLFSMVGSYYHYFVEKNAHKYTHEKLVDQRINLVPFSMIGAGCLGAAALYAFDVAFFSGQVFGSPRPNAGPETSSETFLYSGLNVIVAIAALLVAYAEARTIKRSFYPPTAASTEAATVNTHLLGASHTSSHNTRSEKNLINNSFSPYNRL